MLETVTEIPQSPKAISTRMSAIRQGLENIRAELNALQLKTPRTSAEALARNEHRTTLTREFETLSQEFRQLDEQLPLSRMRAREDAAAARAQANSEADTSARQIVRRMVPLVEQLAELNAELEALSRQVGNRGWPTPFENRPMATAAWLAAARAFVGGQR